jgi:hypothetical protein
MKCDQCGKTNERTTLERVPSGFGGMKLKQICDYCLGELQDYYDNKREEKKLGENNE